MRRILVLAALQGIASDLCINQAANHHFLPKKLPAKYVHFLSLPIHFQIKTMLCGMNCHKIPVTCYICTRSNIFAVIYTCGM